MPDHTNPAALDQFYNLPAVPAVKRSWYRVVWTWIKEDLFAKPFEPIEPISQDGPIHRRIRVHRRAVRLAKRLHWLNQDEAREILAVTSMLLGFEDTRQPVRRARGVRR